MVNGVNRSTRVGVIGTGSMGENHARIYHELPSVELVAVYDEDQDLAIEMAERFATAVLHPEEMWDVVDAVSIAVPTRYHYDYTDRALRSNVHVLVEKPFVEDPDQGLELVERAERNGLVLQVGHVERFNPAVQALGNVLEDHEVIAVDANRLGPPIKAARNIDDDIVNDLMIHDIDVVLSLIESPVTSIQALGTADDKYISTLLGFDGGVVCSLTASRVTQKKVRTLEVTTTNCQIEVDYIDRSLQIHRRSSPEFVTDHGDVRYRNESIVERPMVRNGEPLKKEIESFIDATRDGRDPVVSGRDALRALKLARRISSRVPD